LNHILSFDVSKGKSVVCLINSNKDIIIEPFSINHNKHEFDGLYNIVKKYEGLIVVMESTSIYHYPVQNYFSDKNCIVEVMNPKLVKQFKDTLNKSKTDRIDSLKIARCYLSTIDKFHLKTDEYFKYNPISRQYHSLVEGLVRYKNRYRQLIDIVFPEFQEVFNDLYSNLALSFIHDFPHPELFYNKRIDFLMNYLVKKNGTTQTFRFKSKALKLKQIANDSLWYVSKDSFEVINLVQIIELIWYTQKEIDKLKFLLISSLENTHLFKIINSIPFISPLNTALILSEVGDITRFNISSEFISFCGIDSVIKQSGSSIDYHGAISKSGNKYVRKILFITCTSIISSASRLDQNNPILLFFRKKQKENKHHYVSVIACSTKLCRIIFALCKKDCFYSPRH
jgi:transposase